MAIREILEVPDPRLKVVSEPVGEDEFNDELKQLVEDMFETMYDAPGIGLAAIQIGVPKRVIVMDLAKEGEDPEPRYFVNPEIVWTSYDDRIHEEGCLSLPEYYEEVVRPDEVKVQFLDYNGEPQELHCKDMLAVCIQHEMDHLEGILFIDHLSRLKRQMALKKLKKLRQAA